MNKLFSVVGVSDIVGFIATLIGVCASVYTVNKDTSIGVISIIIAQTLLVIGWCFSLFNKCKDRGLLFQKEEEIDRLKAKISEKEEENKRSNEQIARERKQVTEQLFVISHCVKCNNIHNNDMLVKIPSQADDQYKLLELFESISDGADPEKLVQLKEQVTSSAIKYANQLFELFNRYCRETTDESCRLQNAYFKIRKIPLKVSITVKLMDKPYHPESDRSEDVRIYTAFRDNEVYGIGDREIGEVLYTINGNTDFVTCLKRDYFIINRAESHADSYSNEHRGFNEFYNCAIVVPIRIKRGNGQYKYFGYYCCDCLNTDSSIKVFDKAAAQYMFAVAQNLATFLETLDANWIDRFQSFDDVSDNILEMLFKKIYKPK